MVYAPLSSEPHAAWYLLAGDVVGPIKSSDFWANYAKWSIPRGYVGGLCSLPVFFTVDNGSLQLLDGQNKYEAILYIVEQVWKLDRSKDPTKYAQAWTYLEEYFQKNPLTDPVKQWLHAKVKVPDMPSDLK
jgi:hypothetical protein